MSKAGIAKLNCTDKIFAFTTFCCTDKLFSACQRRNQQQGALLCSTVSCWFCSGFSGLSSQCPNVSQVRQMHARTHTTSKYMLKFAISVERDAQITFPERRPIHWPVFLIRDAVSTKIYSSSSMYLDPGLWEEPRFVIMDPHLRDIGKDLGKKSRLWGKNLA